MSYDGERFDESDIIFEEAERAEKKKLSLIDTLVYADFDRGLFVGKGRAKDFKRK